MIWTRRKPSRHPGRSLLEYPTRKGAAALVALIVGLALVTIGLWECTCSGELMPPPPFWIRRRSSKKQRSAVLWALRGDRMLTASVSW